LYSIGESEEQWLHFNKRRIIAGGGREVMRREYQNKLKSRWEEFSFFILA